MQCMDQQTSNMEPRLDRDIMIKNIDTLKTGKGRGETIDIKDPKFMDKLFKQMKPMTMRKKSNIYF